jgi:hypothetical protein
MQKTRASVNFHSLKVLPASDFERWLMTSSFASILKLSNPAIFRNSFRDSIVAAFQPESCLIKKRKNMASPKIILSKSTLPAQRILLVLNAIQLAYGGFSYFHSTVENKFPVLEGLFNPEIANVCTVSGCWQLIVPFLGSTYSSIVILSILALFFDQDENFA